MQFDWSSFKRCINKWSRFSLTCWDVQSENMLNHYEHVLNLNLYIIQNVGHFMAWPFHAFKSLLFSRHLHVQHSLSQFCVVGKDVVSLRMRQTACSNNNGHYAAYNSQYLPSPRLSSSWLMHWLRNALRDTLAIGVTWLAQTASLLSSE